MESLAALPPLFGDDPLWARVEARFPGFTRPAEGLHTVATAPQLCDGASAAVIGSADARQVLGPRPVAPDRRAGRTPPSARPASTAPSRPPGWR